MSVCTRYFVSCSKCDYVHFLLSSTGLRSAPTEWVYSNGSSESFPLLERLGWCQDCNQVQPHEHIPDRGEIDALVKEFKRDLERFESGKLDWYGAPQADHARSVILNRGAWVEWSRTRNRGRCLTCGSSHVVAIDPSVLWEGKGELPFVHPGCGGALRLGSDEGGIHFDFVRDRDPDEPIRYITYSYAGFPTGDRFDEITRKLEERYPGAIVDLRAALARVVSGQAKCGRDLMFRTLSNGSADSHLESAVLDFIRRELDGGAPDPSASNSLSCGHLEIHRLAAVLIREMLHKLQSTQRTGPRPTQRMTESAIGTATALHRSPFHLLSVSIRDDRRRIVAQAELKSLELDHDECQKSRSDLTNPRSRLSAEMAWLPGVSPRRAAQLLEGLLRDAMAVRVETRIPTLAHCNLLAAAFEAVSASDTADDIAAFIQELARLVDELDPDEILREINEDRSVSGFPEVKGIDLIEAELVDRRRRFKNVIKSALDRLPPNTLLNAVTIAVDGATDGGAGQAPELIDEMVDSYAVEVQSLLDQEAEAIEKLIRAARGSLQAGEAAVTPIIDRLEQVARNWDRLTQPIQLSAKARGIGHEQSREVAFSIRSLAIDLFNDHGMLALSQRLTRLLKGLFAHLPEVSERVNEDAKALADIQAKQLEAQSQAKAREERWAREITFSAEVGVVFKDALNISPAGIEWKGQRYALDTITAARWGSVRHSVNGVPTGTDYQIAFATRSSSTAINLKSEAIYTRFLSALWRAVCVRLMIEMSEALKEGRELGFGDMKVEDTHVTLVRHRLLGANERVRLPWSDVQVWSANGEFGIGSKTDKKLHGSASYMDHWNTHLLEHVVRGGFEKGISRLSGLLCA